MKNSILVLFLLVTISHTEILIKDNQLYQVLNYSGTSYGYKEGLILKDSLKVKSLEATFTIEQLSSKNLTTDILIELLFQDPQELGNNSLKIIRLHIRDKDTSPTLKGTVIECHDMACESYYKNNILKEPFNKIINVNRTHKFKIEHDGESKKFNLHFNNVKETINIIEDFNPKFFKTARIALSVKNHKGKNSKGKVSVYWDDIIINGSLYDDFNINKIDSNKWSKIYKTYNELY